jgi:NitT/TauT family transport system substrate-binding protein
MPKLAAALVFVAATAHAPNVRAQEVQSVSIRMDWLPISYHAPFHLAVAKGYYKAAGIELKLEEGKGSGAAIQLVANNVDTFGFADAAVVAKAVSQNIPVKLVMGVFRRSPVAVVFPERSGIRQPADLKGKRMATCPGDAAAILFPAYLRAAGLQPADVQIMNVDCGSKYTVVAQGLADATLGFGPYGKTMFNAAGIQNVRELDYADAGIDVPSHGIIAALGTIKSRPEVVRHMLAATAKGWNEARQDPKAAVTAMVQRVPIMAGREQALVEELEGYFNYLDTAATKGHPIGWQSAEDWRKAQDILVQYMDLKPRPSVDDYFTNEFLGN